MSKACRECGEPISLRQMVTGPWRAFESDPVALRTSQSPDDGSVIESLDRNDLHVCGSQS